MMKRKRTLRRDLMGKVATVSLVAVALAGCSSAVERFGEPRQRLDGGACHIVEGILLGQAPSAGLAVGTEH